jgi:RteC protein
MPPEIWTAYQTMIASLPDSENIIGSNMVSIARAAIESVRSAMEILKIYCAHNPFKDQISEITFFKIIKPHFHAHLVLWMGIYNVELDHPVGGRKCQSKYIKRWMLYLQDFFFRHIDFYHYYRSGKTDLDEFYFVRNTDNGNFLTDPFMVNSDSHFSSSHDYIVSTILGNEMIEKYLAKSLFHEARPEFNKSQSANSSKLQWTASKTGLVELIYALQIGGVFNDGKAQVHEIAAIFQEQFDVKLINYYHTFNELRSRKKNRTAFLQNLRDDLAHKMDKLEK